MFGAHRTDLFSHSTFHKSSIRESIVTQLRQKNHEVRLAGQPLGCLTDAQNQFAARMTLPQRGASAGFPYTFSETRNVSIQINLELVRHLLEIWPGTSVAFNSYQFSTIEEENENALDNFCNSAGVVAGG